MKGRAVCVLMNFVFWVFFGCFSTDVAVGEVVAVCLSWVCAGCARVFVGVFCVCAGCGWVFAGVLRQS
jgi:hypothetical protein